jgi:hypothetical protein
MDLFFDQVIQSFLMIRDPVGQLLVHDLPLVVAPVHFEHDAVAPVIGHIYMKKVVGVAWDHPEIEFPQTVGSFYQFGKVYIFCEGEVHSVQFSCELLSK